MNKKEIKQQLEKAENLTVQLESFDIDVYRFEGEVYIECEDFDVEFYLFVEETVKSDFGDYFSPPEYTTEKTTIQIDNIKTIDDSGNKHTIVDNQIEKLIKSKIELC